MVPNFIRFPVPVADERLVPNLRSVVERHQRRQRKGQPLWQPVELFHISQKAGHAPGTPFRHGIQGNGKQSVLHIGIVEPVYDLLRKVLKLLAGQGQCGNHLVKDGSLHEVADIPVHHGFLYDIIAAQIGSRHERRVGAVQDTHLSLFIGLLVLRKDHGKPCLRQRELPAYVFRAFDDPEGKGLARHQKAVLIPQRLPFFLLIVSGIARYNTVHQSRCKNARLFQPKLKGIAQLPEIRKPHDAFLQRSAVVINQFHRQHHQPLVPAAAKCLISAV